MTFLKDLSIKSGWNGNMFWMLNWKKKRKYISEIPIKFLEKNAYKVQALNKTSGFKFWMDISKNYEKTIFFQRNLAKNFDSPKWYEKKRELDVIFRSIENTKKNEFNNFWKVNQNQLPQNIYSEWVLKLSEVFEYHLTPDMNWSDFEIGDEKPIF